LTRERKKYGTALNLLAESKKTENVNKDVEEKVNNNVQIDVQENVQENVQKDVNINVDIESKHINETNSLEDLSKSISDKFVEKSKKKTMEETHTRKTFLIENELLKEFNRLTKNKRGYQTMLINEVLRAVINTQNK
jgi:uncharacterized protein (DUF4415 family)